MAIETRLAHLRRGALALAGHAAVVLFIPEMLAWLALQAAEIERNVAPPAAFAALVAGPSRCPAALRPAAAIIPGAAMNEPTEDIAPEVGVGSGYV